MFPGYRADLDFPTPTTPTSSASVSTTNYKNPFDISKEHLLDNLNKLKDVLFKGKHEDDGVHY